MKLPDSIHRKPIGVWPVLLMVFCSIPLLLSACAVQPIEAPGPLVKSVGYTALADKYGLQGGQELDAGEESFSGDGLLKEPAVSSGKSFSYIKKVVIDPGHGGCFRGTRGSNDLLEKDIVLDIGLKLKGILEARGIKVVMTRETDRQLSSNLNKDLDRRAAVANMERPDLFISIHANYCEDESVRGFEIYYSNHKPASNCKKQTIDLANEVKKSLDSLIKDRGVRAKDFRVIKKAECPAILVEVEYLSNKSACQDLSKESYRLDIAKKLLDAILNFGRKAYCAGN